MAVGGVGRHNSVIAAAYPPGSMKVPGTMSSSGTARPALRHRLTEACETLDGRPHVRASGDEPDAPMSQAKEVLGSRRGHPYGWWR